MVDMDGGQFVTLEASSEGPTATITAEISQNSAGAWRGSAKVSVTAPIKFTGGITPDHTYLEMQQIINEMGMPENDQPGPALEIEAYPVVKGDGGDFSERSPYVVMPAGEELELREATSRMLRDTASMVAAGVKTYNDLEASTKEVKVKK